MKYRYAFFSSDNPDDIQGFLDQVSKDGGRLTGMQTDGMMVTLVAEYIIPEPAPREQWEYTVLILRSHPPTLYVQKLDELGEMGWELLKESDAPDDFRNRRCVFKRKKMTDSILDDRSDLDGRSDLDDRSDFALEVNDTEVQKRLGKWDAKKKDPLGLFDPNHIE